ncbi:retrotransposon protein, putative, ty1-copia subclass [Tanacetum coccineum]|uniref:Retrotransposon protein, putative, ty1-copia subclass n=1 Tax=Tanacetum coccineum TaxID=301880 RepID=A0ABQ5B759_9ASTR
MERPAKDDAATKSQQDGLLKLTNDDSFDNANLCLSGKITKIDLSHILTPPYTPQHNGVSKRRNRSLLDMVQSMMNLITLPLSFWDYALESATRILNMVPTKKVDKTPYEMWYGKVPNLSYLKVWGCEALVKRDTPDKLEQRSVKCIFIGYPKETMGYYFYFPPENKIVVARYAEFFEKRLINQEISGRAVDLEEIQEQEDTSPSEITSNIPQEVEGFGPPPQEEEILRRIRVLGLFKKLLLVFFVGILSLAYQSTRPPPPTKVGPLDRLPITSPGIKLRDGRHLSNKKYGVPRDSAKCKIVFVHGFDSVKHHVVIATSASPALIEEVGIYIVLYDRLGYGESDPDPNRTLKSSDLDIEELTDQLRLGPKFYVVGFSMGGQVIWTCLKYILHSPAILSRQDIELVPKFTTGTQAIELSVGEPLSAGLRGEEDQLSVKHQRATSDKEYAEVLRRVRGDNTLTFLLPFKEEQAELKVFSDD